MRGNLRNSPHKANLPFAALCLSAFFMYGVNNVLMSIAPAYITDLGLGMTIAGVQGTIFLVAAIIIRALCTPLFARFGIKPFLILGGASFILALLMMIAFPTLVGFLAARIVQAIGLAVFWPCASSMVIEIAPEEKTGAYIGLFRLVTKVSLTIGPALAFELSDSAGYDGVFIGLLAAAIVASCLSMLTRPNRSKATALADSETAKAPMRGPHPSRGTETDGKDNDAVQRTEFDNADEKLARSRRGEIAIILSSTVLASLSYGLIMNFSALFIGAYYPEANEGLFLTIFSIGCIIANPLFGFAVDRLPWKRLLIVSIGLLSLGIAALALSPKCALLLMPSGIIAGLGSSGSTVCILQGIARTTEGGAQAKLISHQQNCVDISIAISSSMFGVLLSLPIEQSLIYGGWAIVSFAAPILGILATKDRRKNGI